jgi:hypothetical protein
MELRPQLEKWQGQVAEANEDAAADMGVAKRLLTHGLEALAEVERLRITMQQVLADAQAQDVLQEWWPMMELALKTPNA